MHGLPLPIFLRPILVTLILACPGAQAQGSGITAIQGRIRTGDLGGAIGECDRILRHSPGDYRIWTLKGLALRMQGQSPAALVALRKATSLQPRFVPALAAQAQIEYQTGDPACRGTLERLVSIVPGHSTAHAMLAALAFERKDCKATVRHAAKAPQETMDNPLARDQYAACLYRLREFETAADFFRRQLEARESEDVRFNLGLVLFEAKKHAEAVEALKPLSRKSVPDSAALSLLAAAFDAISQTPEAIQTLRQAIELYPREERHYVELAALCLERNAFSVGVEVLKVGEKNIPGSARIQVMSGVLLAREGKLEAAEMAFRRAESLDPATSYGRAGLAAALLQFNAVDEAIALMRDQCKRNPEDARAMALLGQAILQKGNGPEELREAEALLVRAVELAPDDARNHGLLGKVLLLQARFERAVPELEAAIRLDPADRTATYQLMTAYRRLGRTREVPRLQARVRELLEAERNQESEGGRFRLVIREDGTANK